MSPNDQATLTRVRASASPVLSVETLTRLDEAASLAPAWRKLETSQDRATFFQSAAWCLYIWRTRSSVAASDAPEPRVMVIRAGEDVVAIWPLAVRAGLSGRIAQDLTEPFGQYSDILVDTRADLGAIRRAAFAELARWRIDALVLRKVRADSVLASWLSAHGERLTSGEEAPEIALGRVGGHDAWHRSLNTKTRKNLRNYRNRLSREGNLVHEVLDGTENAAASIARCFDGRTGWLQSSGLSSTAFADPAFEAIVGGLASGARGAPPVIALRLSLTPQDPAGAGSEVDLSLHWGFEHGGRYYAYMASKNPAFDSFSPGRLHLESIVSALAARGNETIDLLVPALPYKTSVATGTVAVAGFGLSFSLRGRALVRGWHGLLRPALKAGLLRLPPAVRRLVLRPKTPTAA